MSSPDEPADLDLGRTIRDFAAGQKLFNRYTLVRILGRGGMGIVWLARDEELEHEVALKFLPEFVALDDQAIADLKRETRRSLELHHHHIVRIHHFETDQRVAGISMEYVDGATLSSMKAKSENGCLSAEQIQPWIEQLCEALAYAHTRARIVHRDLKPANLMVNSRSEIKVTDFGIARSIADSVSRVSVVQQTGGTLVYMSPQQLLGAEATVSDDIYSLGATIYDLLAGKPPFYTGDITRQIENVVPPSMTARRAKLGLNGPSIPEKWETTVAACLAKDPAQRPQSAQEVAYRLGLVRHFAPSPTYKPADSEVLQVPLKTRLGKTKGVLAIALGALLVVGAFGGWWFGVEQPRQGAERQRQLTQQKAKDEKDSETTRQREMAEQERLAGETKTNAAADAEKERLAAEHRTNVEDANKKDEARKSPAGASKEQPYVNSLGMKFVPVPRTGVLFCIWETRVKDFKAFVAATKYDATGQMLSLDAEKKYTPDAGLTSTITWKEPGFKQTEEHPVCGVSWQDAVAFCTWLTAEERKAGRLKANQSYRLPTDQEWSAAVELYVERGNTPSERNAKVKGVYPWGTKFPPPSEAGNYAGSEVRIEGWSSDWATVEGYQDQYPRTSPVGNFAANGNGICDLGGNVMEWCEDWMNEKHNSRVLRGASWNVDFPNGLLSSYRFDADPSTRGVSAGFRCVLEVDSPR